MLEMVSGQYTSLGRCCGSWKAYLCLVVSCTLRVVEEHREDTALVDSEFGILGVY